MKLSELKTKLLTIEDLNFVQPNGYYVAKHFHITEVGLITKHFIDCGSTIRTTKAANIQIWVAQDIEHRLTPKGFLAILNLSNSLLADDDLDIEVEYQTETVGKYALNFKDENFILVPTQTNCLAADKCGIAPEKEKLQLIDLGNTTDGCCAPGGGCC